MSEYALFLHDLDLPRDVAAALLAEGGRPFEPIWISDDVTDSRRGDVRALIINELEVDASTLAPYPALAVVSLAFTGYDKVDLCCCKERDLQVYHVPGYSTASVAELAIALTLAVYRQIPRGNHSERLGQWHWNGGPGIELAGKTVGIIGTGRIGIASSRRFRAFDCHVLGWSRTRRETFLGAYVDTLDELLEQSDVVVLHLPASHETRNIIDARRLRLMRPTSVLINVARADLVDTVALADALHDGRLFGAGVDVFDEEPAGTTNRLLQTENVVATPHLGYKTRESLRRRAEEAVRNLVRYANGDPTNRLLGKR